jgi:hypothetical protein
VPFDQTTAFKKTRLGQMDPEAGPSSWTTPQLLKPIDNERENILLDYEAEQPAASSSTTPALLTALTPPPDDPDFNMYIDLPDDFAYQEVSQEICNVEGYTPDAANDLGILSIMEALDPIVPESLPTAASQNPMQPSTHSQPETVLEPPLSATETFQQASGFWFWRIILVLTAWLNLHYHVPHHACILLLKVLRVIFIALGQLGCNDEAPVTLTMTFRHLRFDDQFKIYPTCPQCHQIFPLDSPDTLQCDKCSNALFKFWNVIDKNDSDGATNTKMQSKPILQTPLQLISQPARLLNRYGVEVLCNEWCHREIKPGYMTYIMDGEIWKTLKGHDGKLFFDNSDDRDNSEELRLGITLGFDR